jgi:hypothetical protein
MFDVGFNPALPEVRASRTDIVIDTVDWRRVLDYAPLPYRLAFSTYDWQMIFGAASLQVILVDLLNAHAALRARSQDTLWFAGYPSIELEYHDDRVQLLHTAAHRSPVGPQIEVAEFESALASAAQRVWSVVKAAEREG